MCGMRGWLVGVALLSGCSLVLNPDEDELGGGGDAGMIDGGMIDAPPIDAPGEDVGPLPDVGPRDDVGPGPDGGRDVGTPDARPIDAGCTMEPVCEDGQIVTCDSVTPCALGCAPDGSVRCAEMVPSNVSEDLWLDDARDLTINSPGEVTLFDTNACDATGADSRVSEQTEGGPDVCVLMVRNLRVTTRHASSLRAATARS